ncbi:hypothetical protein [Hydrotalea sp.]|uniref:hypothetical protein n=1 Tax=Hydrotalea sp. TaxID=2881279 RepID=UPI00261260F0|nr:hypothetical protein [Hydrotalea sp.]
MKIKAFILSVFVLGIAAFSTIMRQQPPYHPEFRESSSAFQFGINTAYAYPPAVGILSNSKNCMSCHANNGPWKDENKLIIDVLDMDTKKSLKQPDGSFLIEAKRWEQKTVLTVIGRKKENSVAIPYRNAWLYIDTATIGTHSLSKFAPDWDVNLPMSCRLIGDKLPGYEDADISSLPMTIQPLSNAKNVELQLQVMLTKGESIKGKAQEGMQGNYFEKKVILKIK